ncbi:MAG: glycosyltransferase family 39 protein [Vicinamibacterales bacterium]
MADPTPGAASSAPLDRLYAGALALADWLNAHRSAVLALGAPAVLLAIVGVNRFVLVGFPNSGDEYVYLYQAETMAAGRLWNPAPAPAALFQFSYIVQEPGRAYGSFPFGWPLMLALGLSLGLPAWLVNPLLGTLTLGLVWWLGTRLYSPRVGALAALLVGMTPFFVFNAASYFSHTACGVLLLAAACVAARPDRSPAWVPLTVGLLVGWAVVTRYFTGAVCAVPIALLLLRSGVSRPRTLLLFALGGLPWLVALLAYNEALTGSPWRLTLTPITASLWFRDGFLLRGADILASHIARHVLWTPPALIAVYLVYLRAAPRETRRGAIEWTLVLMAVTMYFYVERGGNQYGPRFHYEAFLFLVPFAAANVFRRVSLIAAPRLDRLVFGGVAASVAVMPVSFGVHAALEREVIRERSDVYADAKAARLSNALVLVGGRVGSDRSMSAQDLTRNGIDYNASVLYGLDPGPAAHCLPGARLPGRTTYLYVWDHIEEDGELRRVACPSPSRPSEGAPVTPGDAPASRRG